MVWTAETSNGRESDKIAVLVVPYLQGKCLDIGCGTAKVWPGLIGVDSLKDYGGQRPDAVDVVCEGEDLTMFSDESFDGIFSSHFLEHVVDYKACLKEWWRVIKPGGHLVMYLPHKELYPNIGKKGSNPDHKHDYMPEDIIEAMKKIGSWELLENEKRDKTNEYSFFQVFKKIEGKGQHIFKIWERNPEGKKRAMVVRYGAIGDQIMAASILPGLKKQGYHVTYSTAPNGYEILKNDPHVDAWWVQGKDFVPNQQLGPYWQGIAFEKRFDLIVNLCESVEGGILTLPGRLQHDYPDETRRKMFGTVNYLERSHDIANVPYEFNARFYPTDEESSAAMRERSKYDGPVVAWAINGSAHHKVYPWVQIVVAWILKHTNAHIIILADGEAGLDLQKGIVTALRKDKVDMKRLHLKAGKWEIRKTLSFAQQADCVVGPETGVLNSVGMEEKVAKVIYLSHSTATNLTKHWKNTITLTPEQSKCPCYPCLRLHYNWDNCNKVEETQAALCSSSIRPELVFESIMKALKMKQVSLKEKPEPTPPCSPSGGTNSMARAA